MQVPLWLFLGSLLLAFTWHDMASMFLRNSFPTSRTGGETVMALWRGIKTISPRVEVPSNILRANNHINPPSLASTSKHFSTTKATTTTLQDNMASKQFLDIIKGRRSVYALKKESTISDKQIQEIIEQVILHVPSSFNSQSTRVVLLVKEEHDKLWDIAKDVLKAIVTEEQWKSTEQRLNGFQGAYGTVSYPTFTSHRTTPH